MMIGNAAAAKTRVRKSALMKSAVKVDSNMIPQRRLDEDDQFQVTSSYSIQFSTCVSLTMEADQDTMFGDDTIEYTKNGKIVAEKSYALFNLCETDNCYYADENLYMVELSEFMQATVDYEPERVKQYCETCQEAQNWCQYGQYEDDAVDDAADADENEDGDEDEDENDEGEDENDEEDEDEDGGDRRRLSRRRKLKNNNFEVVDCDTCESMECFQDEDEQDDGERRRRLDEDDAVEVDMEGVAQWVEGIAQCQQTEAVLGNYNLYAGFICNSDGSGVEIGLFLDEDCTVFTSAEYYSNVVGDDDAPYYEMSQDVVTYPFLNDLNCAERPEYITPEEYEEKQQEDQDEDEEDEDEEDRVNDVCENLFGDDTRSLEDCDANGEEDEEGDDQVEGEEEDYYNWYTYLLSADDADDATAVCYLIQTMEGEYTVVYEGDSSGGSSGGFYDYSSKSSGSDGQSANVALIVIGLLAAAIALVCIVQNCFSTGKAGDSRRENLLNKGRKGALA